MGRWIYSEIDSYEMRGPNSFYHFILNCNLSQTFDSPKIHTYALRFMPVRQYSCYCVSLTLRSITSSSFVLAASPATEATISRSGKCSSIVFPRIMVLWSPINNPYGESYRVLVPNATDWYHAVPNLNSCKFNEINRCLRQLNAQFALFMYANTN
jgi:hypothetical protein